MNRNIFFMRYAKVLAVYVLFYRPLFSSEVVNGRLQDIKAYMLIIKFTINLSIPSVMRKVSLITLLIMRYVLIYIH